MNSPTESVPLLSELTDEQLVAVVGKHLEYCHRHADLREPQRGSFTADMANEVFCCNICLLPQSFNTRHIDTDSLDKYVCDFLVQGVKFNKKHRRCVVPQ